MVSFITASVLDELRAIYPESLPQKVITLPDALSRINLHIGTKFVIIIDEWDIVIRDETLSKKVQDEYINFLRGMFKGILYIYQSRSIEEIILH